VLSLNGRAREGSEERPPIKDEWRHF